MPERDVVALPQGAGQIVPEAGRHEPVGCRGRHLAGPGPRQFGQHGQGLHQLVGAGTALEVDRGQHVRHELAQIVVGGVHLRQAAVVARQRRPAHRGGLPQPAHPDLRAQQAADLLVRNPRVGQHRQDQIQQRLQPRVQ
jgi:hypothetical protein